MFLVNLYDDEFNSGMTPLCIEACWRNGDCFINKSY